VNIRAVLVSYIDEAGDGGAVRAVRDQASPVLVIASLTVDDRQAPALMRDVLLLRQSVWPTRTVRPLIESLSSETKGATLREHTRRSASRRQRASAFKYLQGVLDALDRRGAKLVGAVFVKDVDHRLDEAGFYASAVRAFARDLHHRLEAERDRGLMVLDRRSHYKDVQNVDAVLADKYPAISRGGRLRDDLHRLSLPPLAASSQHVMGLQLADTLASALIFPMACMAYRRTWIANPHVDLGHLDVLNTFASRVRQLEYRYRVTEGRSRRLRRGGIVVTSSKGWLEPLKLYA
jgi:hypothetical protein